MNKFDRFRRFRVGNEYSSNSIYTRNKRNLSKMDSNFDNLNNQLINNFGQNDDIQNQNVNNTGNVNIEHDG